MYLNSGNKTECFGCEGCIQVCAENAISLAEDDEGFRYPAVDAGKCLNCGLCRAVCPFENMPPKDSGNKYVFGGYSLDPEIRFESTSGGAFSAVVNAFCDKDYVIFGAEAEKLRVFHSCITDKAQLGKFRKSKYSQSVMGRSYRQAEDFLKKGKKVLFSGTPCQIAGLLSYLRNTDRANLLTVEVVCEGVPSPLYVRKMDEEIRKRYHAPIGKLDYRYTGKSLFRNGTWDFEKMKITLGETARRTSGEAGRPEPETGGKQIVRDRWFNPFWSVWLQHLMSRPSCYHCRFTTSGRVADITLGDLWGVHLYCPELYGKNGGSSLVVCNTEKGKNVFRKAQREMYGHELAFEDALRYQGPMKKSIPENPDREKFMTDLKSPMDFQTLNRKWAKRPALKLLFQKYIWGNRQKILLWNLLHRENQKNKPRV